MCGGRVQAPLRAVRHNIALPVAPEAPHAGLVLSGWS
jgi:hypothetical protein